MTRQPDDIEFVVRRAGDDPFGDAELRATKGFTSQDIVNAVNDVRNGTYGRAFTTVGPKTADYTANVGQIVLADLSGGSFTLTVPSAPNVGDQFGWKIVAQSARVYGSSTAQNGLKISATVDGITLTEDANGIGLAPFAVNETWIVRWTGTQWITVSRSRLTGPVASMLPGGYDKRGAVLSQPGVNNEGFGYQAFVDLDATATGHSNTGVGFRVGQGLQTGSENVFMGRGAWDATVPDGSNNVVIGAFACHSITSTPAPSLTVVVGDHAGYANQASNIVAIGASALYNNQGGNNVGVGYLALNSNVTGASNTMVGSTAGGFILGNSNTGVGFAALIGSASTTSAAINNTGIGHSALAAITTGTNNSAIGYQALLVSTSAIRNVANGASAGKGVTTGGSNVMVGYQAGWPSSANATTTGQANVYVGQSSGQNSATQRSNTVALGNAALIDGDGAIAIGSGATALAAGAIAIGRDSGGTAATTSVANQIALGTTSHSLLVAGNATIAGAGKLLSFYGATAVVQPTAHAVTTGYTAGVSTAVTTDGTFTGGTGASAYTIGDIVASLKNLGLVAA